MEHPNLWLLANRPNTYLHEWELSLLAKELLINAPNRGGRSLRQYSEMAGALNAIKRLEDDITDRYPLIGDDILLEVYRVAHRQFPWQTPPSIRSLLRYFRIFSDPQLSSVVEQRLGMTVSQLYTLGLCVAGHFLKSFVLRLPLRTQAMGIPDELGRRFIELFAANEQNLRTQAVALQSHDHDYAYTLNPWQFFPMMYVGPGDAPAVVSPIPPYLIRRFTDGIFYDLCNEIGFTEAFGASFQKYVGDVLGVAGGRYPLQILPEREFHDGKNRKDSIDWIATDATGHLFIECKTKRLRADAKVLIASTDVLNAELGKMAAAVVQTYKAIADGDAGRYPHWRPDGRPVHPIVVTLEDWYAWGDRILAPITARVRDGLATAGIDPNVVDQRPYTICSVSEFETMIQVMGSRGIDPVMSSKLNGEARQWGVHAHILNSYRDDAAKADRILFPEDLARIGPASRRGG